MTAGQHEIIRDRLLIVPVEELAPELNVDTSYTALPSLVSQHGQTLPSNR